MGRIINPSCDVSCLRSASHAWVLVSCALLLTQDALAAKWEITPHLGVSTTYSDNIGRDINAAARSDFATEIVPEFSLHGKGRHAEVRANYAAENVTYARENENTTTHRFNGMANVRLVPNLIYFESTASISQQAVSPFGVRPNSNITLNENITEVKTLSASPFLRHNFDNAASAELRYRINTVDTDTNNLTSDSSAQTSFSLQSGPAFRTLNWGVNVNQNELEYKNESNVTLKTVSGNIRYAISPNLQWLATLGYEDHDYAFLAEEPKGRFWSTGVAWSPSPRTQIEFQFGDRFYGRTYALMSTLRTRRTVWSLGYDETLTTTVDQYAMPVTISTIDFLDSLWSGSIPDEARRRDVIEAFIRSSNLPVSLTQPVNLLTNNIFLQKNLQASAAFNSAKSTILVTAFKSTRESQTASVADSLLVSRASADIEQTGGSAIWNWRWTPKTSTNLSLGYSRATSPVINREDDHITARIALIGQLRPRLRASLEYLHYRQDSDQGMQTIKENAITASLLASF